MKRAIAILAVSAALGPANLEHPANLQNSENRSSDWPINGGIDNIRYSPLTQINRDNVSKLQVAWTYDSHDAFKGSEMQSNPSSSTACSTRRRRR